LISLDDFEGIRNQIHSKIKDKIEENPASEEAEADDDTGSGSAVRKVLHPDEVIGGASSPVGNRKVTTNNFLD